MDGTHYDVRLSDKERRLVQLWIDTGAAYSRSYATLNQSAIAVGATGPMIGAWTGICRVRNTTLHLRILSTRAA